MTIRTSNLGGGGSGGGFTLAPDLAYPSSKSSTALLSSAIAGIDGTGGYATALSLSGKWAVSRLSFSAISDGEDYDVRLTVDSVVIWDTTVTGDSGVINLFGSEGSTGILPNGAEIGAFVCDSSLLLEIQSVADTSIVFRYIARPVV